MAQLDVSSGWLRGKICSDGATSYKIGIVEKKCKSCSVWWHLGDYGSYQSRNPP
ncbi:hypothetical protein Hanom_Chr02g00145381 [Helianthus anomalus]